MTNNEIILTYMNLNGLDPDLVVLHTYSQWKSLGFKVKHGEKSHHKISIWKKSSKKVEVEKEDGTTEMIDNGRYFLKNSAFFTQDQVERIAENEKHIQ